MYQDHLADEKETFSPLKGKIIFRDFLAIAIARNTKAMRTIDDLYYSDEKRYLEALNNSRYKNSRIIINTKYYIRENALHALAVIEIAINDKDVYNILYDISRKSFKKIYNKVIDSYTNENKMGSIIFDLVDNGSTDTSMISETGVFYFFYWHIYGGFNFFSLKDYAIINGLLSCSEDCLKPCSESTSKMIESDGTAQVIIRDLLNDDIIRDILKRRSIASMMGVYAGIPQKLDGYLQALWRLTQFDNVPASVYEDEHLSRNDLLDLINMIAWSINKGNLAKDEVYFALLTGMFLRSFSRMHNKLINKLTNNTAKNRISYNENEKKLKLEINSIKDKYDEQVNINRKKQQELNAIQIKYDKSQNTIDTLNSKIEELEEKTRVLEALLERKDVVTPKTGDTKENKKDDDISILKNKNIVVFGGPPNWHTSVKKVLPNATCIPVSNKSFSTSIIDNSDIIVIKTDYLSHAQWYRIINQARNKNKKVLYCQNNIDMLLSDLAENIKDD